MSALIRATSSSRFPALGCLLLGLSLGLASFARDEPPAGEGPHAETAAQEPAASPDDPADALAELRVPAPEDAGDDAPDAPPPAPAAQDPADTAIDAGASAPGAGAALPSLSLEADELDLSGDSATGLSLEAADYAVAPGEPYQPPRDPVVDYLDAIEQVETEGGAYSPALSDLYLGLGQTLLENLEFDRARDAVHRGVLVTRVNFGPNSPEQTNSLFLIADIENRMGDWDKAVDVLDSIYHINAEHYGPADANLIPVVQRMFDWYMALRPLDSPLARYMDFERSRRLAERLALLTEHNLGLGDPQTSAAYRTLGQLHFLTVRYVLSKGISVEPGVVIATGVMHQNLDVEQVSVRDHFIEGRDAFTRFVDSVAADANTTPVVHAEALSQLGDWYLVFNKHRTARELYEEAYRMLVEAEGSTELANAYMGTPTPLRFLNVPVDGAWDQPAQEEGFGVDVSMTVTRNGDLRYVEILDPPEDLTEDQMWEVRQKLRATLFRPGLVNGEVVDTENYVWRYTLPSPEESS